MSNDERIQMSAQRGMMLRKPDGTTMFLREEEICGLLVSMFASNMLWLENPLSGVLLGGEDIDIVVDAIEGIIIRESRIQTLARQMREQRADEQRRNATGVPGA